MFKYNVYLDFYVEHTILSIIFMIFVICTAAVIFKNVFVVEKNYYMKGDNFD